MFANCERFRSRGSVSGTFGVQAPASTEVFYKALANGKSIGDALREKFHVTVRKLRLNRSDI